MGIKPLFALKPLIAKCWKFAPYKLLVSIGLMLLSSFASGIGILMIVPLVASVGIDVGITTSNSGLAHTIDKWASYLEIELTLLFVLSVYVAIILLIAAANFLNSTISTSLRHSFIAHLRSEVARSLFYTQWRYLNQNHMSDFMRLLTGQVQSSSVSVYLLLALLGNVILVCVYLILSFFVSTKLTLIALLCGLLLVALLWPINRRIHASGGVGLDANKDMYRSIFENIASLKMIKSYAAEEQYLQRLSNASQEVELQQVRMAKFNAFTRFVNTFGAAIIFAFLFYSSIEWLQLPSSNLLVLLFIFSRLMPQISSIQGMFQNLIHQAPSYQDLLARSQELKKWAEPENKAAKTPVLENQLILRNVEYKHVSHLESVFGVLNASVPSKKTVAIVGPSGAGKSTLADLISGLIVPSGGQIIIDDKVLDESTSLSWRKKIAYVTQDVFLFHDSIRTNLEWVRNVEQHHSSATLEQELWDALSLANADDFVRALPNGLDTLVGDRGIKLSGGERQRLALARALLSKPELLILDEATSALDRENELKIRDALINLDGKLTIIIIAHNETTIEHVVRRIQL